jgi:ribosomal protein S18 acetylase RimI-like enzyme
MQNDTIRIEAIPIQEHYATISRFMQELHESEKELFDKTALWSDIEASYMRHAIEAQEENEGTCLIAYIAEEPVGFIFGYIDEPDDSRIEEYHDKELYVSDGYVSTAHRRKGIYKLLNDELERIYIAKGVRRILRFTLTSNTRMQGFLESEHYKPVRLLYEKWLGSDGKEVLPLGLHKLSFTKATTTLFFRLFQNSNGQSAGADKSFIFICYPDVPYMRSLTYV